MIKTVIPKHLCCLVLNTSFSVLLKKQAISYLPAGLLPDPVLPPWTEQSLTGPRPCPESCDHVCALPKVQRWPWWTPAFTFSSGGKKKTNDETQEALNSQFNIQKVPYPGRTLTPLSVSLYPHPACTDVQRFPEPIIHSSVSSAPLPCAPPCSCSQS